MDDKSVWPPSSPNSTPADQNMPNPKKSMEPTGSQQKPSIKIKLPRLRIDATQATIEYVEKKFNTKALLYFTGTSSIRLNHADYFLSLLNNIGKQDSIHLILISNGGESTGSLRIANIIKHFTDNLVIMVPFIAASAATNLALAANKIIMTPAGFLTAIDSSIVHSLNPAGPDNRPTSVSVDQVKRVLRFLNEEGPSKNEHGTVDGSYRTLFKYLHPMALGEIDRASSASELIATKMMKMHPESFRDEEHISSIAKRLVNDYPQHAFPILYDEAKEIGLPVEIADEVTSTKLSDLSDACYAASTPERTNYSSKAYKYIEYTIFIESLGRRIAYQVNIEKNFFPEAKQWFYANDDSQWVNVIPSKDGTPAKITPIDLVPKPTPTPNPDITRDKSSLLADRPSIPD